MADENTAVPAGQEANPFTPPAGDSGIPANVAPTQEAAAPAANEQAPAGEAPAKSELVTPPDTKVEKVDSQLGDDGVSIEYAPTGDAGLDVALGFIGGLGIAGNDPAVVAAANGDFTFLKAKLATMDNARGWQQMIALAEDAYGRAKERFNSHVAEVDKAILGVAGSAENWQAIKAWAAANATPEEKKQINAMIDAGPVQARAAATLLRDTYARAIGTTVNPANALRKNASGESPTTESKRLSRQEYAAEVRKLSNTLGTRMESSPEYAALKRRVAL